MQVLVIGASGLVGGALVRAFRTAGHAVVGTCRSRPLPDGYRLDATDPDALRRCVDVVGPETVLLALNTSGGVDPCETDATGARALHVAVALQTAKLAAARGARLVYYSSDYVFDGAAGPYSEDDEPGPVNVYGRAKWEAELVIQDLVPGALIVRTTAVVGWDPSGRNFGMRVLERLGARGVMRVGSDQWCTPTLAADLAAATVRLLAAGAGGIVNVVGRDLVRRSALAAAIGRAAGLDPSFVVPVPTAQLGHQARRPLRAGLTTRRLERLLGAPLPGLDRVAANLGAEWRSEHHGVAVA